MRWMIGLLCCVSGFGATISIEEVLDRPILVNLARRPDRLEVTKALLEEAGFTRVERFDAVDGYYGDPAIFDQLRILGGGKGAKGCAASHLLIWQQLVDSEDRDFAFVVEDDCLPHSAFAWVFPIYWKETPDNLDLVMVGNQIAASPDEPLLVKQPTFCTHAYIISKAGARKLLKLYRQLSADGGAMFVIDIFLIHMMKEEKVKYVCYNGSHYPDLQNIWGENMILGRDGGICFQNARVGVSIHGQ